MDNLRIKVGGNITLQPVEDKSNIECTSIEIFPLGKPVSKEAFRNYVSRISKSEKLLLNTNGTVTFEDGTRCFVKLSPENCLYGFFDDASLQGMEIKTHDSASIEDTHPTLEEPEDVEVPIKSVATE